MLVREYIQNNYSDLEKEFFDYIIDTFPEHILIQDSQESEDVLLLLAILAKAFGSAREAILNLETSHSITELYEKINASNEFSYYVKPEDRTQIATYIENGITEFDAYKNNEAYLAEQNKKLLLPLALDLGYDVNENMTVNEIIEDIITKKPLIDESYQIVKNRGSRFALEKTLNNFVSYLKDVVINYNIFEEDIVVGSSEAYAISVLFNYLEEYVDTSNTAIVSVDGETFDVAGLKNGTILDELIEKVRPAGIPYKILFRYALLIFFNTNINRAIRDNMPSTLDGIVEATTIDSNIDIENTLSFVKSYSDPYSYDVNVTNNSNIASYKFNISDWTEETLLESTDYESKAWRWEVGGSTYTDGNYVFNSIEELNNALPKVSGTKNAVVTGYYWKTTNESTYSNSPKKFLYQLDEAQGDIKKANELKLPDEDIWDSGISTAMKIISVYPAYSYSTYYVLQAKQIGLAKTYYQTAGTFGFDYSQIIISPKQTKMIRRVTNNDNDFTNFYLGVYAQTLNGLQKSSYHVFNQDAGTPESLIIEKPVLTFATDTKGYVILEMQNNNAFQVSATIDYTWSVGGGVYSDSGIRRLYVGPNMTSDIYLLTTILGQQTISFTVTYAYQNITSVETLTVNVNKIRR